jgi:predicted metal-binding membrane protein
MMLPSLVPMLARYRGAVRGTGRMRLGWLTTIVGLGYFFVWSVVGVVLYPLGVPLAAAEMRHEALARAVPLASGALVVAAGLLQFTAWKSHRLACCREAPPPDGADLGAAWRLGLRLGLRCASCCANLMAILLVLGVMDVGAMAVVTAAVTCERLAPPGGRAARTVGVLVVAAGLVLVARAVLR